MHWQNKTQIIKLIYALGPLNEDPNMLSLYQAFYLRWGILDPAAALTHLNKINAPKLAKVDVIYLELFHQWAITEMPSVLNFIQQMEKAQAVVVLIYLLEDSHFAQNQPLFAFAGQYSDQTRTTALLVSVKALSLAEQFDAIVAQPWDRKTKRKVLSDIVSQWMAQAPEVTLKHVLAVQDAQLSHKLALTATRIWLSADIDKALTTMIELGLKRRHLEAVFDVLLFELDITTSLSYASRYTDYLGDWFKPHLIKNGQKKTLVA